jgi:hypothetical protein
LRVLGIHFPTSCYANRSRASLVQCILELRSDHWLQSRVSSWLERGLPNWCGFNHGRCTNWCSVYKDGIYSNTTAIATIRCTTTGILIDTHYYSKADYFKMYKVYCANQQASLNTVEEQKKRNPQFKHYLEVCHTDSRCEGLFLQSFLIKPIQRVCKYPLLLRVCKASATYIQVLMYFINRE